MLCVLVCSSALPDLPITTPVVFRLPGNTTYVSNQKSLKLLNLKGLLLVPNIIMALSEMEQRTPTGDGSTGAMVANLVQTEDSAKFGLLNFN